MKTKIVILYVILFISTFPSCITKEKKEIESPPAYDFTNPIVYNLPQKLNEISGIAFYNNKMFAIQDELGRLFHFDLGSDNIKQSKFSGKADYEDLAILDNQVFILKSNGYIYSFPLSFIDSAEVSQIKEWPFATNRCEYEGMFADSSEQLIYMLSKECKNDKSTQKRTGMVLQWRHDSLILKENFSIDMQLLWNIIGNKKIRFNPSALARHPITHQWYILSASNRLMLITDEKFNPLGTYKLKESHFSQPEGICFDASGNLYISTEKGNSASSKIFKFEIKL